MKRVQWGICYCGDGRHAFPNITTKRASTAWVRDAKKSLVRPIAQAHLIKRTILTEKQPV